MTSDGQGSGGPVDGPAGGAPEASGSPAAAAAGPPGNPAAEPPGAAGADLPDSPADLVADLTRDLAEAPAAEVVVACAVNLMTAAAVKLGLSADHPVRDLDEARRLIDALAGLVAGARDSLSFHGAPVRDGLASLQRAFREASAYPDPPGQGPGERFTGPVV